MYGLDFFAEEPFNKGEQGLTFQLDWTHINGGTFITALPLQQTLLAELGFHFDKGKVSPFLQYSKHTYDAPTGTFLNQYAYQAGLAFWINGHNQNVKVSAGKQHTDNSPDRTQVLVQLQIFYY